MATVRIDDIPFDSGQTFDGDLYFDNNYKDNVVIEVEDQLIDLYEAKENDLEIIITFEMELDLGYSRAIDLTRLLPEKDRDSEILTSYLKDVSLYVGTWISKISNLFRLNNPSTIPIKYASYLAQRIGLTIVSNEWTSESAVRRQLEQAVDLYKIKGTNENIILVGYALGLDLTVFDMYTNDYIIFIPVEWFVGNKGENPEGLDSSYYKSPHFLIEIMANKVINHNSEEFIWDTDLLSLLDTYIEQIRPVNTVPHYTAVLNCITDETGLVYVADGNVKTKVMENWEVSRLFFDSDTSGSTSSSLGFRFDNGQYFDWSKDSYLTNINKWKIGIGNKGISPDETGFVLDDIVLTGDIDYIRIMGDHTEFEFSIPKAYAMDGLSELGLFMSDNTTMVIASTFPDFNKGSDVNMKVIVTILK